MAVLRLADTAEALNISADLREGSAELELVRRGALRGLSVEFAPLRERRESNGLRVVTRAALPAIGLVDSGSYRTAVELRHAAATLDVESRARMGRTVAVGIPADRKLACECSPGSRFAELVATGLAAAFDEAFAEVKDTVATWANYSQPLASVSRGTLRRTGPTDLAIDLPDDDFGRAVIAAHSSAGSSFGRTSILWTAWGKSWARRWSTRGR